MRGSGTVDDGGAGDEGAGGEDSNAALEENTEAETTPAGREFASPLGSDALAGTGHPGEHGRRGERGDGGAQGGTGTVEQSPDGTVGYAESGGDLLVAVPGKGGATRRSPPLSA